MKYLKFISTLLKLLWVIVSPSNWEINLVPHATPLGSFCPPLWREVFDVRSLASVPYFVFVQNFSWISASKCRTYGNKMEPDNIKPTEYEYETQFFGFTPESFVDGGNFGKSLVAIWSQCERYGRETTFKVHVVCLLENYVLNFAVYNAVNDYVIDCFQELENLLKSEVSWPGSWLKTRNRPPPPDPSLPQSI